MYEFLSHLGCGTRGCHYCQCGKITSLGSEGSIKTYEIRHWQQAFSTVLARGRLTADSYQMCADLNAKRLSSCHVSLLVIISQFASTFHSLFYVFLCVKFFIPFFPLLQAFANSIPTPHPILTSEKSLFHLEVTILPLCDCLILKCRTMDLIQTSHFLPCSTL